ncbi:hypothetical protein EIH07_00930 [Chryseobacterium taklimakanense]|uniref:hypothetical protein n=1 Tax=Chryseobacterium taklimakanense TaxID=536441 RepID=UPI000F5EC3C5|nr:hypothetical protein [Chryseobacterium taklimakanense]AZI21705.1 hypothetical protein EIH07_00930 [Chryseobacterium taklimakanense]
MEIFLLCKIYFAGRMKFVHLDLRCRHPGEKVPIHSIKKIHVKKVEANEQNDQGCKFLQKIGSRNSKPVSG